MKTMMKTVLLVGILCSLATNVMAQSRIWDGGAGTSSFDAAQNWSGDTLPSSVSQAQFGELYPGGGFPSGTSISIGSPRTQSGLVFWSDQDITISGAALTLSGSAAVGARGMGDFTIENSLAIPASAVPWYITSTGTGTLAIDGGISSVTTRVVVIGNSGGTALGTVQFGGAAANSYLGTTIVEQNSTLVLNKSAGATAIPGSVRVNSGATLRLAAGNQIADNAGLNLFNGGTFDANGQTERMAALNVTGTGNKIRLGAGAANITFSSASGTGVTIYDWEGNAGQSGTAGRVFINTAPSDTWLASVTFEGFTQGAMLIAGNELVPSAVPEPAAMCMLTGLGLAGLAAWRNRKLDTKE
jgi:hypothetical protein